MQAYLILAWLHGLSVVRNKRCPTRCPGSAMTYGQNDQKFLQYNLICKFLYILTLALILHAN